MVPLRAAPVFWLAVKANVPLPLPLLGVMFEMKVPGLVVAATVQLFGAQPPGVSVTLTGPCCPPPEGTVTGLGEAPTVQVGGAA
jgi:hypothetical protein